MVEPVALAEARETRVGTAILLAFVLLITLPYLWAALLTPPGFAWGGLLFSADDQNVHLMWARQIHDGALFSRDLFTTEGLLSGEKPLFFNALTALMGLFSRLSGLDAIWFYHAFRVGAAAWALHQLHRLARAATANRPAATNARLWTLALAAFTLGSGFLATVFPALLGPLTFLDRPDSPGAALVPEGFFLTSALLYPLNIASLGLLAWLFRALIEDDTKTDEKTPPRRALWTFAAALALSNIHTYDALPFVVALLAGVAFFGRFKPSRLQIAALVGAILPILYQFLVFRGSQEFRLKALTVTAPPPLLHLLVSFAPLLILAAFGTRQRREFPALRWLFIWIFSTLLLLYAPTSLFPFARKMIEGWQLPLLVLAGLGLAHLARKPPMGALVVGVLSLSPLLLGSWILNNASENNASRWSVWMPPLYLADSQMAALHALESAPKTGAVLCLPFLGSYVPRATGRFVYLGHWAETLDFGRKLGEVSAFYGGKMSDEQARDFLKKNRIVYVMESSFERALFPGSTAQKLGLTPVFRADDRDGGTRVYAVP